MPEPIISIAIVKALAGPAIKTLMSNQDPDPADWSEAIVAVIDALLQRQDDISDALGRLERKLDELAQRDFRSAFGAARHFLAEARTADNEEDRSSDLRDARRKLIEALQLADTQPEPCLSRGWVNWHLAMVYLLSGKSSKCLDALVDARDDVARGLLTAVAECSQISAEPDEHRKVFHRHLYTGVSDKKLNKALMPRYLEVAKRDGARKQLAEFEAVIEAVRRQLGVPEPACVPIEIVKFRDEPSRLFGTVLPGGQPYACVELQSGPNDVLHIGVEVHRAVLHHEYGANCGSADPPTWFVDVDLELTLPGGSGTHSPCLGLGSYDYPVLGPGHFPYFHEPVSLPKVPVPQFRTSKALGWGRWVEPLTKGSQPTRGWVRVPGIGRPEVLLVRLFPFETPIGLCRQARCREQQSADYITAIADLAAFSGAQLPSRLRQRQPDGS